jgi:beta-phosphoglucomutase family hydrolase
MGELGLPAGIRGALFDLDGVLTRTTKAHESAWKDTFDPLLAEHGQPPFTHQDYLRFVDGKRREDGVRDLFTSRGITLTEDQVHEIGTRKNDLLLHILETGGVFVYDGSVRYLKACADKGIRRAVVSSSANTHAVLSGAGILDLVELEVNGATAAAMNLPGKPAPDTFLEAARELGLRPDECAVFEDALAGVAAGRAGKFGLVVGVDRTGSAAALREHGADVVVEDLEDLL